MGDGRYGRLEGRCDLSDPVSLYLLCSCFLESIVREFSGLMARAGSGGEEDIRRAGAAFMAVEDRFASLVSGCHADVPVSPLVRDGTVARGIRQHFAARLISLPEEEREMMCRDDAIFIFAVEMFRREICQAMLESGGLSPGEGTARRRADDARSLCVRWTEIFTGRKYPREMFPAFDAGSPGPLSGS